MVGKYLLSLWFGGLNDQFYQVPSHQQLNASRTMEILTQRKTHTQLNARLSQETFYIQSSIFDSICGVPLLTGSEIFCFDAGKEPNVIFSLVPSNLPLHSQGSEIQDTQPHFGVKFTNKSSFKSPYRCYFLKRNPQHFSTISILREDFSGHNISLTQGAWVCATRLRMFFFMVFSKRAFLWQSQRDKWKSLVVLQNRPNHWGWSVKANYLWNWLQGGMSGKKSSCWIAIFWTKKAMSHMSTIATVVVWP